MIGARSSCVSFFPERQSMTINEKDEIILSQEAERFTVYNKEPNYYIPSEDRFLKFKLDGDSKVTYWNHHDYLLLLSSRNEERKKRELETRCRIQGKNGKLIRCMKSCSECNQYRTNHTVSLDELSSQGFDIASDVNVVKDYIKKELLNKYFSVLSDFSETDKAIITRTISGLKTTEISKELGIPQQTVCYRKTKCLEKLKILLKDYF